MPCACLPESTSPNSKDPTGCSVELVGQVGFEVVIWVWSWVLFWGADNKLFWIRFFGLGIVDLVCFMYSVFFGLLPSSFTCNDIVSCKTCNTL